MQFASRKREIPDRFPKEEKDFFTLPKPQRGPKPLGKAENFLKK